MIKILFADDDLKYSMLLKSFLQQHGYDVTYAGNGKARRHGNSSRR